MWTCQDGLTLSPRTSRQFAGSMSPPLPARPATLWPASCHGSTWPGNGHGSCRALLGQALLPGAGYPATAGEESGCELTTCEEWIKLVLRQNWDWHSCNKEPIWMKRSRVNGARAGQSSGVAESTPSDQSPEQVPHSSKNQLVWWQLLGRQQTLNFLLPLFNFVASHSLIRI